MVAMIDPRSMATAYVVERNAAAQPVTVMVVQGGGRQFYPEAGKLFRLVSVDDERDSLALGEPTWEDAAWQ